VGCGYWQRARYAGKAYGHSRSGGVRMAEIYERHAVLTLDSDFSVYRKHGRVPLALIHPAEG
jgi:hypothetical protein